MPISWVEVLEVLWMLDAQVLVCLSVGLKCWKSCGCWMHRYLCAYQLGLSVGTSKDVGCTGTPVSIGWFDVLGEICC